MKHSHQFLLCILAALFGPFLALATMFVIAEPLYGKSPGWDGLQMSGVTGGTFLGIYSILLLPLRRTLKVPFAFLYWLVMTFLLLAWALIFTGWAFGRHL